MADYFAHWLRIGKTSGAKLPRIFMVNWFRKGQDGKFLWPGFGDNSRVLAYVLGRLDGEGEVVETPVGLVPTPEALPLEGLDISGDTLEELLSVDAEQVRSQLPQIEEHLDRFGDSLPGEVRAQFESLKARLGSPLGSGAQPWR
jgi:phosphoenolpyruvate carboxykinase (GTP)